MTPSQSPSPDPFISKLLADIPSEIRDTFSTDQLHALKVAFGAKQWAEHPVDMRSSFGFGRWRYYWVFVAGRDRRQLSERRLKLLRRTKLLLLGSYLITSTLLGVFALYLLKSALGIDIFPGFSFGLWDWFKEHACRG